MTNIAIGFSFSSIVTKHTFTLDGQPVLFIAVMHRVLVAVNTVRPVFHDLFMTDPDTLFSLNHVIFNIGMTRETTIIIDQDLVLFALGYLWQIDGPSDVIELSKKVSSYAGPLMAAKAGYFLVHACL